MAGRVASALARPAPAAPKPKPKPRRAQHRQTATSGTSGSRSKSSPNKSILERLSAAVSSLPASLPPITSPGPSSLDVPLSCFPFASGMAPALIRRRPTVGVLDMPISVCTRFATWLETQRYVHDETLLRAVERDGSHLLCLAKATLMFDNALRGHVPTTVNGVAGPLSEHARTLRCFAELLTFKISEGSLSEELETAVLRDGEALLRLAICCLEFDQTIRGSGSAQVGG